MMQKPGSSPVRISRMSRWMEALRGILAIPSRLRRISVSGEMRKILNHKLTIMVVPHNALSRFHMQFTFSFFIFVIGFSIGLFSWAAVAVTSNIDYWSMKVNHEVLKLKVQYFASELRRSREMLEGVKEADIQLRKLLKMNSRQQILDAEDDAKTGQGGPEPFEASILQKTLEKHLWDITDSEIQQAARAIRKESGYRLESFKEISEYIAYERGYSRSFPIGWPAPGRLTSHFGQRVNPMHGGPEYHMGLDIANEKGTIVKATADGIVQVADWEGGYGRLIIIDHGFGFKTYYGHNSDLKVSVGQHVKRGQEISYMGSTGSSTASHVHYEVWQYGRQVDPWKFVTSAGPVRDGDNVQVARKILLGTAVGASRGLPETGENQ